MLFLKTLEDKAAPAHTALVVADMQRGYWPPVREHLGPAEVSPQVQSFITAAREVPVPIIYIRNSFSPWAALPSWEERWQYSIPDATHYKQEETPGLDLIDGLEPRPGELVLNHHFWTGFVHSPLDLALRTRRIKTVVFIGGAVLGALWMAAREAVVHGYYAVMVEDCMFPLAGPVRDVSLEYADKRLAQVVSSRELLGVWAKL